jgi:hypothetical protein
MNAAWMHLRMSAGRSAGSSLIFSGLDQPNLKMAGGLLARISWARETEQAFVLVVTHQLSQRTSVMTDRRRSDKAISLQDRLMADAADFKLQAAKIPPGLERDKLLKRARHADTEAHLDS